MINEAILMDRKGMVKIVQPVLIQNSYIDTDDSYIVFLYYRDMVEICAKIHKTSNTSGRVTLAQNVDSQLPICSMYATTLTGGASYLRITSEHNIDFSSSAGLSDSSEQNYIFYNLKILKEVI